jgi:hypothetical protein
MEGQKIKKNNPELDVQIIMCLLTSFTSFLVFPFNDTSISGLNEMAEDIQGHVIG